MPSITTGNIAEQPRYLPITAEELKNIGRTAPDIILVSADAYVDHPSFAAALLGRTLINAGFSVAIISQPDWKDREGTDFAQFGRPNLFFAVLPGAVDPMVSAYTPALRCRHDDAYSPGGKLTRPEKTTLVYTNILHRLFKDTPIIIGGIEASLRRLAHYDYWSDSVKQGILADAPASLLIYGMGELQMIEIADRLKNGESVKDLTDIRGTCYTMSIAAFRENPPAGTILPAYPAVVNKETYAEAFKIQHLSKDTLIQPHPKTVIVQNPPAHPLTTEELDIIYDLPYTRKQHPAYKEPIPALTPIQFSITITAVFFGMDFYSVIFIGTALTATSIAITANVLREMGKLHQPFAKAIIGVAVIDDILSLIVLSICTDLSSTGELVPLAIGLTVIKAFGFVIIAAGVGVKVIPILITKMDGTKIARQFPEFVFIFAMMIAFFYAMMAEMVGISAIVGAFLAGVCVNRVSLKHSMDIKLGTEYLYIIFAAIFFVSLGIIADLRYLTQDMVLFIVILTIVAVITKVVGCGLPAKLTGMSWRDSALIGFGMTPRGEVAMIVGLIALTRFEEMAAAAADPVEAEYLLQLGNELFIAIVVVSLVTTVIVPMIYKGFFFRAEKPKSLACEPDQET